MTAYSLLHEVWDDDSFVENSDLLRQPLQQQSKQPTPTDPTPTPANFVTLENEARPVAQPGDMLVRSPDPADLPYSPDVLTHVHAMEVQIAQLRAIVDELRTRQPQRATRAANNSNDMWTYVALGALAIFALDAFGTPGRR